MIELGAQKKKAQARHHCGMLCFKPSIDSQDTFQSMLFWWLRSHDCQKIVECQPFTVHPYKNRIEIRSSVATLLPWLGNIFDIPHKNTTRLPKIEIYNLVARREGRLELMRSDTTWSL